MVNSGACGCVDHASAMSSRMNISVQAPPSTSSARKINAWSRRGSVSCGTSDSGLGGLAGSVDVPSESALWTAISEGSARAAASPPDALARYIAASAVASNAAALSPVAASALW
jgi:hypothetical protein